MEDNVPEAPAPIKIDGRKLRKKSPKPQKRKYTRRAVPWQQRKGPIADAMRAKQRAVLEEKVWGPRRRSEVPAPRQGIPDGMNREQAEAMWAEARRSAEETMKELIEKDLIVPSETVTDEQAAVEAMTTALTIMRSASHMDLRLKASLGILPYLKAKPEVKSKVTVESAEQWLAQVVAADANDDAGTS